MPIPGSTTQGNGSAIEPRWIGVQAINGVLGVVPRTQYPGEPADGDVVNNMTHQFTLEHALGADWRARAALGARDGALKGISTEPSSLRADNRTLWRQRRDRDYRSDDLSLQAELQGRVKAAGIVHEVMIGLESYRFKFDQRMLRINPSAAAPYAIDLLAPVYGQVPPTLTAQYRHPRRAARQRVDAAGRHGAGAAVARGGRRAGSIAFASRWIIAAPASAPSKAHPNPAASWRVVAAECAVDPVRQCRQELPCQRGQYCRRTGLRARIGHGLRDRREVGGGRRWAKRVAGCSALGVGTRHCWDLAS